MKAYNNFTDKFNNEYKFDNYLDFATFWFRLNKKVQMSYFSNYKELNKLACNSKESRIKL